MRGKVLFSLLCVPICRITPAYAGKSSAFIRSSPVNQDHPRLCGEKGSGGGEYSNCEDHPRLCGEKLSAALDWEEG